MGKIESLHIKDAVNQSLLAYIKAMYRGYDIADHHQKIATVLEKLERGEIDRLIIEAPPRHGKTMETSEYFPAWYFGKHPNDEIIYGTYAQSLANKVGRKVRNQMCTDMHRKFFPDCRISMDSKSKNEFATMQGGEYHALGVDGQATGKGAHLVILDDTLKGRKQAEGQTIRETVHEFYRSSIYTRLYPGARIVIMQTRWHHDDIIGYVLREHGDENWHVLKLPALDETGTKALWPARYPVEKLLKIKKTLGPYDWEALYQQNPSPKKGAIFNRDWWKFYKELPEKFDSLVMSWDMAFKKTEDSSFVVGQVWGKKGPNAYLIYQYRDRISFTDTLRAFVRVVNEYPKVYRKLVEDKANGPAIIDVLKNQIHGIIPVEVEGSKEARASAISPIVESGCVYLPDPKMQSWVIPYIDEHTNFPKGQDDDQVDATSQALSDLYGSHTDRLKSLLIY